MDSSLGAQITPLIINMAILVGIALLLIRLFKKKGHSKDIERLTHQQERLIEENKKLQQKLEELERFYGKK